MQKNGFSLLCNVIPGSHSHPKNAETERESFAFLCFFFFVCLFFFFTECLIRVLFLDVTRRLTNGRALHRILCKAWHAVDLLYHNVPSMSPLSTLQVPFSFFFPGVYREMDQQPVHEKVATLSAPSCSTKQEEHFHELLVVDLKAHLHPRLIAVVCFCFESLYCPNA